MAQSYLIKCMITALFLVLPLSITTCFPSEKSTESRMNATCVRIVMTGTDVVKRGQTRDATIRRLNDLLRSWASGRSSIPTIVWDVEGSDIIAEIDRHSCTNAKKLIGEILGEKIDSSMYRCEGCRWSTR